MRLDKYLQQSRLVKRRAVANELCRQGYISVNGRPGKPSTLVKPGDRLRLEVGERALVVEVVDAPSAKGARPEGPMFRIIEEAPIRSETGEP